VQLLAGGRRLRATAACCELLPISRRAVCHRRLGITRRFRRPPSSVARPRQSPAACSSWPPPSPHPTLIVPPAGS